MLYEVITDDLFIACGHFWVNARNVDDRTAVRVNLDSHISRIDLIGKDAIKLVDGKQVTSYNFV